MDIVFEKNRKEEIERTCPYREKVFVRRYRPSEWDEEKKCVRIYPEKNEYVYNCRHFSGGQGGNFECDANEFYCIYQVINNILTQRNNETSNRNPGE